MHQLREGDTIYDECCSTVLHCSGVGCEGGLSFGGAVGEVTEL